MIRPRCCAAVAKDFGTPLVHYSWATGYSFVSRKIAVPVILAGILVLEKLDQEIDHLKSELDF